MTVERSIIVSSGVSDVRVAAQIGSQLLIPYAGISVAGELNILMLWDMNIYDLDPGPYRHPLPLSGPDRV